MRLMLPDREILVRTIRIPAAHGSIPALLLSLRTATDNATGVLWLHGGGYAVGMKEMVHMSRAVGLVKRFGVVVLAPGYRLSLQSPYPAAMDDCYAALLYLKEHAAALGVRSDQIMVGGESAGGGLCAAVCIRARDTGEVMWHFRCRSTRCSTTVTRKPPARTTAGSGTRAGTILHGGCTYAERRSNFLSAGAGKLCRAV